MPAVRKGGSRIPPVVEIDLSPYSWMSLYAALMWPGDAKKARMLIATFSSTMMGEDDLIDEVAEVVADLRLAEEAEHRCMQKPDLLLHYGQDYRRHLISEARDQIEQEFRDELFVPAGGHKAVSREGFNTLRKQIDRNIKSRGKRAGDLLCLIAQLDLYHQEIGGSFGRGWLVAEAQRRRLSVEQLRKLGPHGIDSSFFRKSIWNPMKGIAPLHAAQSIASARKQILFPGSSANWSADDVVEIVAWAKWLRNWAVRFKPERAGPRPLIGPEDAFTYECPGFPVEPVEPPLMPLNPARLALALAYPLEPLSAKSKDITAS